MVEFSGAIEYGPKVSLSKIYMYWFYDLCGSTVSPIGKRIKKKLFHLDVTVSFHEFLDYLCAFECNAMWHCKQGDSSCSSCKIIETL